MTLKFTNCTRAIVKRNGVKYRSGQNVRMRVPDWWARMSDAWLKLQLVYHYTNVHTSKETKVMRYTGVICVSKKYGTDTFTIREIRT